ncbi:MAG: hypothetical protein PHF86_05420 [Candidatus Nanoarchaeia archaeon]|nr:hypothetical protein [Candidatus Nanoarchaeia archaeon]
MTKTNQNLEKITEKVFREGIDFMQSIIMLQDARDQIEDTQSIFKDFKKEKISNILERRKRLKKRLRECNDYIKETPAKIIQLRDKFVSNFNDLTQTEKGIFLKELFSLRPYQSLYPRPFVDLSSPIYTKDSFKSCSPAFFEIEYFSKYSLNKLSENGDYGGSYGERPYDKRFLELETTPFAVYPGTRNYLYDLKKNVKNTDLIKVVDFFDFVPKKIPAQFVSYGLITSGKSEGGMMHYKREIECNACSNRDINWDNETFNLTLHIVDFDKLCGVKGLTEHTIKVTKNVKGSFKA